MEIPELPQASSIARHPTFSAFQHRNFQLYFLGQGLSLVGTWSQSLAISWLVWRLTHSAAWLGIIGFILQFPMLLFGLPGGWAADRFDRRRSLILLQALSLLQALILASLTLSGHVTLLQLLILSALLGTIYAFEFPMRQSLIMDMVGRRHLLNAISLNAAMFHASRIAGPMLAGWIVAWKGEGICFLFNAVTFLFFIAALMRMRQGELIAVRHEEAPIIISIVEGLRYAHKNAEARLAFILLAFVATIGMAVLSLFPIFADRIYQGGAVEFGWMMAASGLGALTGALWLAGRQSNARLLALSAGVSVLFSLSLILFAHLPSLGIALPVLAASGFFLTVHFSSINTLLQRDVPDRLRGRMMSLFTTVAMGLSPIGILIIGFVAREIGAPLTTTIVGAVCLIAATLVWLKARTFGDSGRP